MSGLVGLLSDHAARWSPWLLQAVGLLSHTPRYGTLRWQDSSLSLAYASVRPADDQLDVATVDGICLFVAGEVYNIPDVCEANGHTGGGRRSQRAQALLDMYLTHGMEAFRDLNGAYVLGVWDERVRRLHLVTDRLGLRKMYYALTPSGELLFASEVKALLAHPQVNRAPDLRGLAHFLALGHLLDDRTLQEAVRLLPGGTRLDYAAEQRAVQLEPYWTFRYATTTTGLSVTDCADELWCRLERAVARRIQAARHIGIPVSGGLDSRTLLGMVRDLRPFDALHTFSAGHDHTADVISGRRMAQICRTSHTYLPLAADFMARDGEAFVWLTDGMVTLHNCWGMELAKRAAECCDEVLIGFLGDVMNNHAIFYRPPLSGVDERTIARDMAQAYVKVFSDDELSTLLQPSYARQLRGMAVEDFQRAVYEAQADDIADRALITELRQRQSRNTSFLLTLFGAYGPVSAPFTDNEVVEFLSAVPYRYRNNKQAYQAMICRQLPRLARVTYDATGLPLDAGWLRQRLHWRWERLRERQLPRWTGGRYRPHNRMAYAHYNEWMRREPTRSYVERTLTRGERYLAQWCDIAAVRRLLAAHLDGRVDAYRKLSALVTLVLWCEQVDTIPSAGASASAPAQRVPAPRAEALAR